MQFLKALRERVRRGEITSSVRLWQGPRVRVGGFYPLAPGAIEVMRLREISLTDVTPELARQGGFAGVVDLLKVAKHGTGRRVFLVDFRYLLPKEESAMAAKKKVVNPKIKDGDRCEVVGGVHKGKSGKATDLNVSKTGHLTITVVQANGSRFKTLGRNVKIN